jgi:chromosome partitioning protein
MGRIIAVSNLKGGIGKTTTVVNLGAGLALKGARVLLVDVDAQGNLAMALGVHPRHTVYEALVDGRPAAECITPARPNLDLIAADATLLGAQPIIAQRPDWSRALYKAIRPLIPDYDYILIDSAGSLTPLNVNALVCAGDVIAPTAIEHFSIQSLGLLFTQVARVKGGSASIRMIIPTMYDPRVRQSGELLEGLRARYGALVGPPIRVNVRLSESPRHGQTIYEYDPRSRGALDYALLVEYVSQVFDGLAEAPPSLNGAPTPAATRATAAAVASAPTVATEPNPPPAPDGTPDPTRVRIGLAGPKPCPHCGRPLRITHAAGYAIAYCDYCKYQTQTLARGPR